MPAEQRRSLLVDVCCISRLLPLRFGSLSRHLFPTGLCAACLSYDWTKMQLLSQIQLKTSNVFSFLCSKPGRFLGSTTDWIVQLLFSYLHVACFSYNSQFPVSSSCPPLLFGIAPVGDFLMLSFFFPPEGWMLKSCIMLKSLHPHQLTPRPLQHFLKSTQDLFFCSHFKKAKQPRKGKKKRLTCWQTVEWAEKRGLILIRLNSD